MLPVFCSQNQIKCYRKREQGSEQMRLFIYQALYNQTQIAIKICQSQNINIARPMKRTPNGGRLQNPNSTLNQSDYQNAANSQHLAHKFSLQKLGDGYVSTLESIVISLCQYISSSVNEQICIKHLDQYLQELKFHEKIQKEDNSTISNIVDNLEETLKFVVKGTFANNNFRTTNVHFPQVKSTINDQIGYPSHQQYRLGSLATIAQKASQQNLLLSNYLRKNHGNLHSKILRRNLNNNSSLAEHHSQSIQNPQVMRQQTRRSLDIQHHMQKQQKKLYHELQKIKGKDIIGLTKSHFFHIQDKRDKKTRKYKLNEYHITKYI